ncbi:hypothetical protein ACHAWO_005804 [Cyclotella atomus]|uniref:Uncharacterized protein n=1 Tax=Cyclotella atomus TaxID=382360 RepID=A0ABD3P0M8_9STRA
METIWVSPMPSLRPFYGHHGGMMQALMLLYAEESSPDSGSDIVLCWVQEGRYIAQNAPVNPGGTSIFALGDVCANGDVVHKIEPILLKSSWLLQSESEMEIWRALAAYVPLSSCMFLLVSSLGGMRG